MYSGKWWIFVHRLPEYNQERNTMVSLKVSFICGDFSGPYFHDIGIPMKYFHKYNLLECNTHNQLSLNILSQSDVVFFQRQYAVGSLNLIKKLRKCGVATIAHCDDNVWELHATNPAYSTYQGDTVERFNEILAAAHLVTTSTPYLASLCRKYNPNVHIFRNLVDMSITNLLSPGRDNPDEIRIGWTGTPHHYDDILLVESALRIVVEKDPRVKLVFMGFQPPHLTEMVPPYRTEFYSFVEPEYFYPALANLDFDIGIAPLVNTPFNWGKTARKAQEYAALKVAMVLSPIRTYEDWVHNETCLKPTRNNKPSDWVDTILELVEDKAKRETLVENAYKFVKENHDIDTYIHERAEVFYEARRIADGE
jgi:glycosyltransferase involved in cell wall biosynthesis